MQSWGTRGAWGLSLGIAVSACTGGSDDGGAAGTETTSATTTVGTGGPNTSSGGVDDSTGAGTETTGAAACPPDLAPGPTLVVTDQGPMQGAMTDDGAVAFLGMPYAAPPVGDLRWAPPQPVACDPDVRDATQLGSRCAQLQDAVGPVIGDEDCLHVNVWTPAADDGARPVMVFIHGGGNAIGSAVDPLYDGASLALAGDQVVVTLNYRLGALGWLTHPDLPEVNFGLRDQVAALQWVAANIDRFGGDPSRVTIFGESAGAVNVCALLGSPLAAGLFAGAIVQSGGCRQRDTPTYATDLSDPFVAAAGCDADPDPIACLRQLPAEAVLTTEPTGFPSVGGLGQGWGPSVDPATLPVSTLDAMEAGTHNIVPTIIGANAEETANDAPPLADEAAYVALVNASFGIFADDVLMAYPISDYGDDPVATWVALISDVKFVCSARESIRAATTGGSPTWRYEFAFDGYTTGPTMEAAAFHGLELVYIFGNFDAVTFAGFRYQPNADDLTMRDTMQAAWSSFAATGSPMTTPAWPAYAVGTDPYLSLDVPSVAGQGVRTVQCDFWQSLIPG